ncbi:MAG TPA: bifunctional riboflavin kinase/FAD synthetase [Caulobacteraceae bacterium]|jgi:riboflavin kinase/FMN adenylyltransferase
MAPQVFHQWRDLPPEAKGAAVAFGNFDGVHLGHQGVIRQAAEAAYRLGAPLGVVTLEPHPQRLFHPDSPPSRLMNLRQLGRALAELGVEQLHLLPFGHQMANLSAHAFVEDILVHGLGVRHVAVGFDVTFGNNRTGDPQVMRRCGEAFGFSVSVTEEIDGPDGAKISSTAIRDALRDGDPVGAAKLLGRPFAIEGVVEKGQQLGRKLGIPTANVSLGEYVTPRLGVYATRTRLKDGRHLGGVANIGVNPTTGVVAARLEVFIFNFDEDIYGEVIETELIEFIRPEEKFDSIEDMLAVIRGDVVKAREILG